MSDFGDFETDQLELELMRPLFAHGALNLLSFEFKIKFSAFNNEVIKPTS